MRLTLSTDATRRRTPWRPILAFSLVMSTMPLGHAAMVAASRWLPGREAAVAGLCFLSGLGLLAAARRIGSSEGQTLAGLFAGLLLWIGAFEYPLVLAARHLGVGKTANGTGGEYRLLEYTAGFAAFFVCELLVGRRTRCPFFLGLRKLLRIKSIPADIPGSPAAATAWEFILVTWSFYALLLLAYDERLFGPFSTMADLIFVACAGGGVYLLWRLSRIRDLGHALRYSIPTVVVVWTGLVEIPAKRGIYREPWVTLEPAIMLPIAAAFVLALALFVGEHQTTKSRKH